MRDRFDEVLEEAAILGDLDAARAEVWVSGLLGEWDDIDDLLGRLGSSDDPAALAVARALGPVVPDAAAVADLLAARGVAEPDWAAVVGTARAQQAWEIIDPFSGNVSIVIEYEHEDLVRHSMLVEIEESRAVDILFGPPGLVDDAFDESDTRSLSVRDLEVDDATDRIVAALVATAAGEDVPVTDEFVMNVALAMARVGAGEALVGRPETPLGDGAAPVPAPAAVRTRDPLDAEADAAACATLRAALARELRAEAPSVACSVNATRVRDALLDGSSPDLESLAADAGIADADALDDGTLLARLAGAFVVPGRLAAFTPAEREAIRGLEWADWMGAVIPLVRGGVGASSEPLDLVRNINRCGEVTTTVPKRDIPAVADVFARTLHAWELTGALDDHGRLTALGHWLIPRALLAAWGANEPT